MEIPRDVAEKTGVPADLDAGTVGPYRFPNPRRRRVAAAFYGAGAIVSTLISVRFGSNWWVPAIMLTLAVWNLASAWPLGVDQEEALAKAAPQVPFVVGQVSAAVTFHGWRGRPRWHVVVYDPFEPPRQRALVVVDGVTGELVGETYVEDLEAAVS
jgi:hypothetical protein